MNNFANKTAVILFGLLGLIHSSYGALSNIGGGLVNDSTLNITWLQDANMVNTLCKANDALWQSWPEPNPAVVNNSGRTKNTICANNGTLNWYEAENWIAHLNTNNYLSHNDWRQPATTQPDTSCESTFAPNEHGGYNCRESELGHLFNTSLTNPNHAGTGNSVDPAKNGVVGTNCFAGTGGTAPADCFQNVGPFSNAQSSGYWSGSSYAPGPIVAWFFDTNVGRQTSDDKDEVNLYVWPVRSGQSVVASAQPIPTMSVWGLGIMVLLIGGLARRKV